MKPTIEYLRDLFEYDRDEGALYWRTRPLEHFKSQSVCASWNAKLAGKRAGHVNSEGYRKIGIDGVYYAEHRLIWFIETGSWPMEVDHRNGVKSNNRFTNLKDGSHADNMKNQAVYRNNTSGHVGVMWEKSKQLWVARISINGKLRTLGRSKDKDRVIALRKAAERELGYSDFHGRAA